MKVSRREALAAIGATALLAPRASQASPSSSMQGALESALAAFFAGWSSGHWQPFLDLCDDAMVFQFPAGDQRGRHEAPKGKQALVAWATAHRDGGNRITQSAIDLKLFAGDWLIVCDRGSGIIAGTPYTGLHAIFMRAGTDGRIVEFREYFGEIA